MRAMKHQNVQCVRRYERMEHCSRHEDMESVCRHEKMERVNRHEDTKYFNRHENDQRVIKILVKKRVDKGVEEEIILKFNLKNGLWINTTGLTH